MLIILCENQSKLSQFAKELNGKSQHINKYMYVIFNSKKLTFHPKILLAYLPINLYVFKRPVLANPIFQHSLIQDILFTKLSLKLQLNPYYSVYLDELLKKIQVNKIWVILDKTNIIQQIELEYFLGRNGLINQYQYTLYPSIKNMFLSPHEPKLDTKEINQKLYLELVRQLYTTNYSRGVNTLMEKYNVPYFYNLSISRLCVLNQILQHTDKQDLVFTDDNHHKWVLFNKFTKQQQNNLKQTTTIKPQIMKISTNTVKIHMPYLLNLSSLEALILKKYPKLNSQKIEMVLKNLYLKYQLCTNPDTNINKITNAEYQFLKRYLPNIKHLYLAIHHNVSLKYVHNYVNSKTHFVDNKQTNSAIIPCKIITYQQYKSLPKLYQYIYDILLRSILIMFSDDCVGHHSILKCKWENYVFTLKNFIPIQLGWRHLYKNVYQKLPNYKTHQRLQGTLALKSNVHLTNEFLFNNILNYFHIWKPIQRLSNLEHLIKEHYIKYSNNNWKLTIKSVFILRYLQHIFTKKSPQENGGSYVIVQQHLYDEAKKDKSTQKQYLQKRLHQIIINTKAIFKHQGVIKMNKNVVQHHNHVLNKKTQATNITCPYCHKGKLILQIITYKNKNTEHIKRDFVCSKHCGIDLPAQFYNFVIQSNMLPLIFSNLFAPIEFKTKTGSLWGRIVYYHHTLIIKKVPHATSY